jgi:hypothetical protein
MTTNEPFLPSFLRAGYFYAYHLSLFLYVPVKKVITRDFLN